MPWILVRGDPELPLWQSVACSYLLRHPSSPTMDIFKYIDFIYMKISGPHEEKCVLLVFLSLAHFAKMMMWCPCHSLCD